MKPAAFTYHRARTIPGAVGLLDELGDDAKVIAGGQSLVAMMNFRLARPEHLIDIARIPGLDAITRDGDALRVGALVTHHAVETADLGPGFRVLSDAMAWVGHLPIRTRGTIGGSIAHADATAEWCLLAVLLDALVVVEGPRGRRSIPAEEFFQGVFTTALQADELIVEVLFPRPAPRAALTEYAERRGDFAIVAAAVDLDAARVVLGGVAPVPLRVPAAEAVLAEALSGYECLNDSRALVSYSRAAAAAAEAIEARDEPGLSAHYRRGLVRTLVARACTEASGPEGVG
ncbi:xanthine dehydrogenase family protein subunit M [Pseudonocardia sp. MH-G8]|uniref:FAD binding domain-containing protein n=1 Tax=Pseudonocardia sp. MH-G8 TaxID=1854588 RepID=UPI000BA14897|nr:FAD binding domain-containing protein [Pseudonocardia sp. MH-G8]OZM81242.1 molybdopterin dehydrogenase [Pseudonocardia sp. MH-G8]